MPRKPRTPGAALPAIAPELLESFGNGPMTAEAINAASLAFKKALIERALAGEMNHYLGRGRQASDSQQPAQWQGCQDGTDRGWPDPH